MADEGGKGRNDKAANRNLNTEGKWGENGTFRSSKKEKEEKKGKEIEGAEWRMNNDTEERMTRWTVNVELTKKQGSASQLIQKQDKIR